MSDLTPISNQDLVVVEDNTDLREELARLFADAGYSVQEASHHAGLMDIIRTSSVRLIILDLNLPGTSGYEIAQQLRATEPGIGIIMLTARGRTADRVRGYTDGADIYMTKPAEPAELLAATAGLWRRMSEDRERNGLELSAHRHRLRTPAGQEIKLTPAETAILRALAFAPESKMETGEILDLIEEKFPLRQPTRRSIENIISRLRNKLTEAGGDGESLIHSVRNIGYQLGVPLSLHE